MRRMVTAPRNIGHSKESFDKGKCFSSILVLLFPFFTYDSVATYFSLIFFFISFSWRKIVSANGVKTIGIEHLKLIKLLCEAQRVVSKDGSISSICMAVHDSLPIKRWSLYFSLTEPLFDLLTIERDGSDIPVLLPQLYARWKIKTSDFLRLR